MSQTAKVLIGLFAVIVVAGGVWWFVSGMQGATAPSGTSNPPAAAPAPAAPSPSPAASAGGSNNGGGTSVSTQSNTNASLTQDLNSFDSQVAGMNSDSASIDQGLNDTPVPQN